jgi:hypothetical protein
MGNLLIYSAAVDFCIWQREAEANPESRSGQGFRVASDLRNDRVLTGGETAKGRVGGTSMRAAGAMLSQRDTSVANSSEEDEEWSQTSHMGGQDEIFTAIMVVDLVPCALGSVPADPAGETGICRRQSSCYDLWRRCRVVAERPAADRSLSSRRSHRLRQDCLRQARRARPGHRRLATHSLHRSGCTVPYKLLSLDEVRGFKFHPVRSDPFHGIDPLVGSPRKMGQRRVP